MININFKIENPETAYVLGYLWADGSVFESKGQYYTRLFIQNGDGEIIKPFIKKFSYHKKWVWYRYHYPSATRNNNPKIQFAIYNKDLSKFLIEKLGYGNKSLYSPDKALAFIPSKYHKDFWRGLFDGDGHIGSRGATITSNYDQDWSALISLFSRLDIKRYRIIKKICKKHGHKSSVIDITNASDITKLGDFLYEKNCNICLPRKQIKFATLKQKMLSWNKSSKHVGVSYNKANKKWKADICKNKQKYFLGYFLTEEDALRARMKKESELK